MRLSRILVVLALAATPACRCGPPSTGNQLPDFDPDPKALSFEACPVLDENGDPVQDVYPDEKTFTLRNLGKADGDVVLTLSGTDKDVFSLVQDKVPAVVLATLSEEIPIRFSPVKKGDAQATLTIDDGVEETPPVSVALIGTGRNLPSQPTLEVSLQDKDVPDEFKPCVAGVSCTHVFPDTFYKESSSLKIKVRNLGCPALKITGIEITPVSAGAGNLAFSVVQPEVLPTPSLPLLLTTADDRAEDELVVRFAPESDNSGTTQRYAVLTLQTNDPSLNAGDGDPSNDGKFDLLLAGNAAEPSLYAQPTFCDFSNPSDLCGHPTKVTNKARFELRNGGNTPIVIDRVELEAKGQGRFTYDSTLLGSTIPVAGSRVFEVSHVEAPSYLTATLTISGNSSGQSAGTVVLSLSGGIKPCLSTDPVSQLDFENPTTELTTKTVAVKNGAGCGDLVINRVFVDPNPFFSVVDPQSPPGEVVPAGSSRIVSVQYKRPPSGGSQASVLRIDTNDPDFGPPPYKVVTLYSQSPVDNLPEAVLEGCLPSDPSCNTPYGGSMTVHLSTLNPKELIMSGAKSNDPGNTSATPISNYRFQLFKPSNANGASLENDGQKTPKSTAKLTLDPAVTGLYKVVLTVWDDRNQQSGNASELKIYVTQ